MPHGCLSTGRVPSPPLWCPPPRPSPPHAQNHLDAKRKEAAQLGSEVRALKSAVEGLQSELTKTKIEGREMANYAGVLKRTAVVEMKKDDAARRFAEKFERQRMEQALREAEVPIGAFRVVVAQMEQEVAAHDERFVATKRAMASELEWMRAENRKGRLLVDGARKAADQAVKARFEAEEACQRTLDANQLEVERVRGECRREVERLEAVVEGVEERLERTRQELDDERRMHLDDLAEVRRLEAAVKVVETERDDALIQIPPLVER